MKKIKFPILFTVMTLFQCFSLMANNIQVSNITLTTKDTANNFRIVQFNLSWENSWRIATAPFNYDAAWVFVKYRITVANGGDGLWKHAFLNNPTCRGLCAHKPKSQNKKNQCSSETNQKK